MICFLYFVSEIDALKTSIASYSIDTGLVLLLLVW